MELQPVYSASKVEREISEYWESRRIYEKVREMRKGGKKFFFVDGPPYTTGHIHLGTAWNKIIKDAVLRYRSMQGFDVLDRAGWDMHGLPIEVRVEEILGFQTKKDIENYGIERFVEECKKFAIRNREEMTKEFKRLGVWMRWDDPYQTIREEYIDSEWWAFKRIFERGLVEEKLRVINCCPRCETALAEAEVEYENVTDPSIYVKFPTRDGKFILIWTTTPWTIPANVAVAIHPEHEYVEVLARKDGKEEKLFLAERMLDVIKGEYDDLRILRRGKGKEFEGMKYVHPLEDDIPAQKEIEHSVYVDEFVTLEEGTGCVHIAPAFGEEDFELGRKYGLPVFCPVGMNGKFTHLGGKYEGMDVRRANREVIEDLRRKGLLLREGKITHRYGHCWRCKSPIIFMATKQLFIKASQLREEMMDAIRNVKWYPEWAGMSRFADWISQAKDWCISRQRYWGTPIPLWVCEKCGRRKVIGGVDELRRYAEVKDVHIPHIDEVRLRCECGGDMRRIRDVFDVWFDSAVASWGTLGYPRERENFNLWPPDFITEGHDQTRGWFYSQLVTSMIAFGRAPYKSVLVHGFTLDESGRKMSKSLGNVIDPIDVVEKYGADALRVYMLSVSPVWEDLRFSWNGVANAFRVLNIFWNVCRFSISYMKLDGYSHDPGSYDRLKANLRIEDLWMLSRIESLVDEVTQSMEKYELHRALRSILNFILDDLSRWYIPLVRPRTWIEYEDGDKEAAYFVLYHSISTVLKLLAPFAPHICEKIYLSMDGGESVHLLRWPESNKGWINKELEDQMQIAKEIVEAAKRARQSVGRKLRWPVKSIHVCSESEKVREAVNRMREVILNQANAKDLIWGGETQCCAEFSGGLVYIDPTLTKEMEMEGYAKEIIRRVQEMRKEMDLGMEERIEVGFVADEDIIEVLKGMGEYIMREVRARDLKIGEANGYVKSWKIDEKEVKIGIVRWREGG